MNDFVCNLEELRPSFTSMVGFSCLLLMRFLQPHIDSEIRRVRTVGSGNGTNFEHGLFLGEGV